MNFIIIACVFIVLDFVFGLGKALISKTFESRKMRQGLENKMSELSILALAALCTATFPYVGITITFPIVESISVYIILMELASMLENIGKCSPAMGEIIKKAFGGYFENK